MDYWRHVRWQCNAGAAHFIPIPLKKNSIFYGVILHFSFIKVLQNIPQVAISHSFSFIHFHNISWHFFHICLAPLYWWWQVCHTTGDKIQPVQTTLWWGGKTHQVAWNVTKSHLKWLCHKTPAPAVSNRQVTVRVKYSFSQT